MNKGIKQNPDFIDASTFGQLYKVCLHRDAEFKMMQKNTSSVETLPNDWSELQPGDHEEEYNGVFVLRQLEKELMSDQLPFFIKVPNGRHKMGLKRDCYTLNGSMTNPEWMKCFQMIGALIGRSMARDE